MPVAGGTAYAAPVIVSVLRERGPTAVFFLLVPAVAFVWPFVVLDRRKRRSWRRWGIGGCLVFGLTITTAATAGVPDAGGLSGLIVVPLWLIGVFNLVVAVVLLVVSDREWSSASRLVAVVVAIGTVAAVTGAGVVLATWPRLPTPATPQAGQVTGVVGENTVYGWRQIQSVGQQYQVVVAVPVDSFRELRALSLDHWSFPVDADAVLAVDGVRVGFVDNGAFTLDGLSAQRSYRICVGRESHGNDLWTLDVCPIPKLEIPGQLRVEYNPYHYGGTLVVPLS